MTICNQGCGTHVYFRDGMPYNVCDDEPHKKTCMSLKMGKWWGGQYNTIPMDSILSYIEYAFECADIACQTRTVDDMIKAVKETQERLGHVLTKMAEQEKKNKKWKEEFAEYKTNLVQEQTLREERKRTYGEKKQTSQFTTADKL